MNAALKIIHSWLSLKTWVKIWLIWWVWVWYGKSKSLI